MAAEMDALLAVGIANCDAGKHKLQHQHLIVGAEIYVLTVLLQIPLF